MESKPIIKITKGHVADSSACVAGESRVGFAFDPDGLLVYLTCECGKVWEITVARDVMEQWVRYDKKNKSPEMKTREQREHDERIARRMAIARIFRKYSKELTSREQDVLKMRFGMDDGLPHTLEEVGHAFGVTRERIRQIQAKALEQISECGSELEKSIIDSFLYGRKQ